MYKQDSEIEVGKKWKNSAIMNVFLNEWLHRGHNQQFLKKKFFTPQAPLGATVLFKQNFKKICF